MDRPKMKIAIVDDEKNFVDMVRNLLEERGFAVIAAYDGASALRLIKNEKPDVIILDIVMPGMEGRDVLVRLKKDEATKDIPVIMMTGKDEQFDRDYALRLGATEYLTKPYESVQLLRQINTILDKRQKGEI